MQALATTHTHTHLMLLWCCVRTVAHIAAVVLCAGLLWCCMRGYVLLQVWVCVAAAMLCACLPWCRVCRCCAGLHVCICACVGPLCVHACMHACCGADCRCVSVHAVVVRRVCKVPVLMIMHHQGNVVSGCRCSTPIAQAASAAGQYFNIFMAACLLTWHGVEMLP